jgi:hypothetical protein
VRDQVSHPYKTTGKIIVMYILIFVYLAIIEEVTLSVCFKISLRHIFC